MWNLHAFTLLYWQNVSFGVYRKLKPFCYTATILVKNTWQQKRIHLIYIKKIDPIYIEMDVFVHLWSQIKYVPDLMSIWTIRVWLDHISIPLWSWYMRMVQILIWSGTHTWYSVRCRSSINFFLLLMDLTSFCEWLFVHDLT